MQLLYRHQLDTLTDKQWQFLLLVMYNVCVEKDLYLNLAANCPFLPKDLEQLAITKRWNSFIPDFVEEFKEACQTLQMALNAECDHQIVCQMVYYCCFLYPLIFKEMYTKIARQKLAIFSPRIYEAHKLTMELNVLFNPFADIQVIETLNELTTLTQKQADILITTYPVFEINGIIIRQIDHLLTSEDIIWLYKIFRSLKFHLPLS